MSSHTKLTEALATVNRLLDVGATVQLTGVGVAVWINDGEDGEDKVSLSGDDCRALAAAFKALASATAKE